MVKEISEELALAVINGKFLECKDIHNDSCTYHAVEKFFLVFRTAVKFYLPIHVIPLICFKIKKLREQPLPTLKGLLKNIFMSCLFMSSYIALFRFFLCFNKNVRGKIDIWNVIIAGLISTFGIIFEPSGRRAELALYILPKSLEALWKWLLKRDLVKPIKHGEVLLFAIGMGIIMHCYQADEKNVKPTYLSIIKKFFGTN